MAIDPNNSRFLPANRQQSVGGGSDSAFGVPAVNRQQSFGDLSFLSPGQSAGNDIGADFLGNFSDLPIPGKTGFDATQGLGFDSSFLDPTGAGQFPGVGGGADAGGGFNASDFFFGEVGADGKRGKSAAGQVGGLALGGAQALLGLRGLRNAEDALDFQKQNAAENFRIQKSTVNRQLEDRQRGRVASNPTTALSVADYMAKFGV